jgi:ABC-type lipoprotein export system ATPase subunit
MKELIIIRGVPGSGKSTMALYMWDGDRSAGMSAVVLEADMFMLNENGNYQFDGTRLKECHQKCQQFTCMEMVRQTERIYVANTFVKKWEADAYYALAKVWGYTVRIYRLEGNFENTHGVPQDRVDIMRANMEPYEGEVYK